jgi:AcrR family transcriptional regulator
VAAADTRTRMIEAAERLFAERGIGAVSMREVAVAAGQRTSTAAQYHFSTRDGLLRAVYEHRLREVNRRRLQLLEDLERRGRADDVRCLLEAFIAPIAALLDERRPTWWARFLDQAMSDPGAAVLTLDSPELSGVRLILVRVRRHLDHLPPQVRERRVAWMSRFVVHALAEHERSSADRPHRAEETEAFVRDLVDANHGLLAAPASGPTAFRRRPPLPQ